MKIVASKNGKQTIKMSRTEWENIGKKTGWIKEAQTDEEGEQMEYESIYEVPVPPDHRANSRVIKTYPAGQYSEIEKYDDGYFGVVNKVHGTTTHWTKSWEEAKRLANETSGVYRSKERGL